MSGAKTHILELVSESLESKCFFGERPVSLLMLNQAPGSSPSSTLSLFIMCVFSEDERHEVESPKAVFIAVSPTESTKN